MPAAPAAADTATRMRHRAGASGAGTRSV